MQVKVRHRIPMDFVIDLERPVISFKALAAI